MRKVELRVGIPLKLKALLESKKQDIFAAAARYGAYNVRIFGSVARGDDDESKRY